MEKQKISFPSAETTLFFNGNIRELQEIMPAHTEVIVITDEQVNHLFPDIAAVFHKCIVIPAGERYKNMDTVAGIIKQLMAFGADRGSFIVGIGGGVVTDIAGFTANIYLRGVPFGFVPTTVLGMVDASIGGKNGVDFGIFKNILGTFRQPGFLFYDYRFLDKLPELETANGFAEIIKHGCALDAGLFGFLENRSLDGFISDTSLWEQLIPWNVKLKAGIVQQDEKEADVRRLLNFGHTLGHAIENDHQLPHGYAVAIGSVFAAWLSEKLLGFPDFERVKKLFAAYKLPVSTDFEVDRVMQNLVADKKRTGDCIHYILLEQIGKSKQMPVPVAAFREWLTEYRQLDI